MAAKVKVYSTPACPWCVKAKEWLKSNKVKFTEVDVAEDEKGREEMIEKSGQMGVPVIVVEKDGKETIIVGFDQGKLKTALGL
ncbi:glutathione S-transferase N-terminal domain-containing protein [Candidatus Woesearchaeota archaeon]|nr:glutathione S-transferase N-terminal domain-containing protein [Candidatus Woesearchaeota archaeon]